MARRPRSVQLATEPAGTWVQVEREALGKVAKLTVSHPKAAALLQVMLQHLGRGNALVASQATLARLVGCTDRTIRRSLDVLKSGNWVEVRQIGPTGSTNAYIVNDRVAWYGTREGLRFSLFSATVLLSDAEQPDRDELGRQPPLEPFPTITLEAPKPVALPPQPQPDLVELESDPPTRRR